MQNDSIKWPLACAGFALIAGILGFFFGENYQTMIDMETLSQKDTMIMGLQQSLSAKSPTQSPTPPSPVGVPSAPQIQTPAITSFTAPKSGDWLCRGTTIRLSWKGDPARVDEVMISLSGSVPIPLPPIVDALLTWNETGTIGDGTVEWTVGANPGTAVDNPQLTDGQLYRFHLTALKNGAVVDTKDAGPFAISTCKG